ncbi:beta-lactamase family protein [Actinotalea sp. M2MS4P-6]|uniref:serine hydrolase domain-containing protein n=1 Tax=Actinotalea sp. M2MS4P-6 TaxID=2983762 RepID=UPI0021E514AA|nr:serine hydrolase domain-containing protein [Actinotalea sp. M2MS4P-6]MCV2393153.1 beta-lactamase family protein [Actinotalea sp. M2MS4P-6]
MSLARAVDLVRRRGGAAQLVVLRHDEVVLDLAVGGPGRTRCSGPSRRASPVSVIHALVERGRLGLDDPVSRAWPSFARGGKAEVTVRQVLQHRSGLTTGGTTVGDALAMNDWRRMVRRAERAPLRRPPGSAPAYQYLLYGFVLGEIAQRVTGEPLSELVRALVLQPAGLHDTHLGLPPARVDRAVPVRAPGPRGALLSAAVNRRTTRAAVNPSAGVSTTARGLAGLYRALLDGEIVRADTLAQATTPSCDGETDLFARVPIRWSQGFQLGGPRWVEGRFSPMARAAARGPSGTTARTPASGGPTPAASPSPTRPIDRALPSTSPTWPTRCSPG